jgi:hypothetical protein
MRPAFASTQQAAAFALLLLVLLLLPVLLTKSLLPPREEIYGWSGWDGTGPHPYHHRLIFEEKGDIDIAFIGSSQMEHAIDTPLVQEKLSAMIGRQATVRTLGWGGAGYDALYFITKDLLQNRKVRMIVIYDETQVYNRVNPLAPNWFRFGDDAGSLALLPLDRKLTYYYAAILGVPKNILSLLRPNLPADMSPAKMKYVEQYYHAGNIVEQLGAFASHLGFNYSTIFDDYGPFIPYTPDTQAEPSDVVVYSPETQSQFQFSGAPTPAWQLHFGREFTTLAQQDGVKLVLVHLPTIKDMRAPVVDEREFWPDALQADISMVGIPSTTLFKGLTDDEVRKLFKDDVHLNTNGQVYYTSLIIPALLKIYTAQTNH